MLLASLEIVNVQHVLYIYTDECRRTRLRTPARMGAALWVLCRML